ncbi:MAG: hypothetical protein IH852_09300 [Bacteroidetes bacterium]|nr:hypothetical protein [Bacteroidota bacterium]
MVNSIIYITGSDGSGKTTLINLIEKKLLEENKLYDTIWIRSPKIFSKPLMAYCRIAGLTKYKTIGGIKCGVHEFYRSPFVSWLFPFLQLIDFKIKKSIIFRKFHRRKNHILLIDRFAIDTLADLMVDTGRYGLHLTKVGKAFLNTIPRNTKIFVLKVDEKEIRLRKKDTLYDAHLSKRIEVFDILSKDLGIKVIDNNRPLETVRNEIFNKLGLNGRI